MQKEAVFFSSPSSKISLNQLSPKLSQVRTKSINAAVSPLAKFSSPKNSSQQGSPSQGPSPGLKMPKNQIDNSPTVIKAKSNLTNLKLSVFQETSLLSPFFQTEASSTRSLTGTTVLETIESNQNSSTYNQSIGSEENLRPSKWKGNQDKLRKTQIIQSQKQVITAVSGRQKSLDSKELNGVVAKTKLIKVVQTPSPKILTKQLSNVKSGVQTPTSNFCLPSPKRTPLPIKANFFGRRDLPETTNNTPRRPDEPNVKSAFARPLSARNNTIASGENVETKEEQPEIEVPEQSQRIFTKRRSRVMTKELEEKYGIKMADSNDSSLISDESLGDTQLEKSPSEALKISLLADAESVCLDTRGESKYESKMRDFLIKRQEIKSLRSSRRVNSMVPSNVLDEKQSAQGKRVKTMIANDDYWGPQSGKIQAEAARRKEDLFVGGGESDYFQLNTENLRYSDYANYYQDNVAALQQKSQRKEKDWGERKLSNDEYKPMVVWFGGTRGRIIQPKYMSHMGSMCYTEFWPKSMSMKIQKMVIKEGDYVKLTNTERNHETVYRPTKWNHEDGVKKRVDVNVQAMKGGHEREVGMAKEKNKIRDQARAKKGKK